jgi:hypothetical protein
MKPQLAIDRYRELQESGLDTFGIIRQLRHEYALSIGQAKEIMIRHETGQSLTDYQGTLLEPLIQAFEEADLPEPEFEIDDAVETVGEQHSFRHGFIQERIWHHNEEQWHYYLVVDGKRVSKRYCSSDLRRTNNSESGPRD